MGRDSSAQGSAVGCDPANGLVPSTPVAANEDGRHPFLTPPGRSIRGCVWPESLFSEEMISTPGIHPRAAHLIAVLQLEPHPEGGYFRRIFRSDAQVTPLDNRPDRSALTTIYYLLPTGERSCWHRVSSDEVWHFIEGSPLELMCAEENFPAVNLHLLGPLEEERQPVRIVPRNQWQAARSTGPFTLAGCTVGPGFEFSDFEMLRSLPDQARTLRANHPRLAPFI